MRLFREIAGRLALLWGLGLVNACTSALTLYPIPTDDTDAGAGGGVPDGEGGGDGRPDKCEGIDVSVGLIASFLFDGDTRDATGHGHDGIPEGDVLFITEGRHGQAILFSSREARVTVPDDAALDTDDEFSLAAWVRPSVYSAAPGDNPTILAKWLNSPNEYDYVLNVQAERAAFSIGNIELHAEDGIIPSSHVKHPWSIPVGAWTHVAATFNRGELRLFINGQLAAQKTSAVERTSSVEYAHDDVIIGNVFSDYTHDYTWQGALDDVRIYGPALSALQIACLARQ